MPDKLDDLRAELAPRRESWPPSAVSLEYGCYVTPTIISVDTKHSLWREEVFGPVVAVCEATGFDETVKEQGSPGLRFYTRVKTTAVRFAW